MRLFLLHSIYFVLIEVYVANSHPLAFSNKKIFLKERIRFYLKFLIIIFYIFFLLYLWIKSIFIIKYIPNHYSTYFFKLAIFFELLFKIKSTLFHLKVLRCIEYVLLYSFLQIKLDSKAFYIFLVDCDVQSKDNWCYDPVYYWIVINYDVAFFKDFICIFHSTTTLALDIFE